MPRNIPLFIAFRLLFNSRFYYPIFAVLQLDYGLTMEQFALLNAVWAASIVLLEVPSGALADMIGRKRMVVAASFLMVIEMAVIAFVPLGNASLVFWAWVINRILSGAAEAAASGADEALAYDSLPQDQQESLWSQVLARLMRLSSLAFVFAMLIGAAIYDPSFINRVAGYVGWELNLEKGDTLRFPVYLTLCTAVGAVLVSLAMKEPRQETHCAVEDADGSEGKGGLWSGVMHAGVWILRTPLVFALILAAVIHDSLVRLILTVNSEYYRLIQIPDAAFGVLGAAFAGMGLITPLFARRMIDSGRIERNYLTVSALIFAGLIGVALAIPYYGVLVILLLSLAFGLLNFFTSYYLNREVASERRATVLSFRGLALNLAFGAISVFYAGLLRALEEPGVDPETALESGDRATFRESLWYFPPAFLVMLVPLVWYYFARVKQLRK